MVIIVFVIGTVALGASGAGVEAFLAFVLLILVLVGVRAYLAARRRRAEERRRQEAVATRRAALIERYGDERLVDAVMARRIWRGMSEGMLRDSWGAPAAMDESVLKTKTVRLYKYNPLTANRFRDRIKVEDGVVVGWERAADPG